MRECLTRLFHVRKIILYDRNTRPGGGVCLLIKNNCKFSTCQVTLPPEFMGLEILAVDLKDMSNSNVLPLRLAVAYRPPDFDRKENDLFFSALDYLAKDSGRLCITGDLNLPDFEWELFLHPDTSLYNAVALNLICSHGLTQFVKEPTRADRILDVVLCSDVLCCDRINCLPPLGSSDHNIVSFMLAISLPVIDTDRGLSLRPNFHRADWNSLLLYLSSVNWTSEFYTCASATDMWSKFTDIVNVGISLYVPNFKSPTSAHTRCVYPVRIRKFYARKLASWKLYKTFRSPELLVKYRKISKACSLAVTNFRNHFEENLVNNGNLGAFYKYVNNKLNGSNGIAPLQNKGGDLITSNADKAALLNSYFSSVFTVDNGRIDAAELPTLSLPTTPLSSPCFTPAAVMKYIKLLKANSGGGPDGLPAVFFKNTADCISYPLAMLFNLSMQTADIPPVWKLASITPIFKKGSPSDPANYRPISLTCIACKIIEAGIKDSLLNHMHSSGLLNASQHGFLKNKSTTTQLLECCSDWNVALKSKKSVDVIYLDYAKAFDSVVHSKLIAKLLSYGLSIMLVEWINSFLVGRSQFVRIGSSISNYCDVLSGVPQGSVLGPILFIIYVNDIPRGRGIELKLFADDTKLYSVLQDDSISSADLQECLNSIYEWSTEWQLKLSPAKCTVMRIHSGRSSASQPNYHIGGLRLPVVTSCTDLGVTYDERLSFSSHCSKVVVKASQRAKLILKCFTSRDSKLLMRAFCTFVRPLLEFSSTIWSPYTIVDINRIESVQRRFTKAINNLSFSSYSERLLNLRVDSLQCRRIKADLILCYNLLHHRVETNFNKFFTLSENTQLRGNKFKLVKSKFASVRDANFFANRVVNIWNALPDSIVTAGSISSFKHRLKSFDFSNFTIFA